MKEGGKSGSSGGAGNGKQMRKKRRKEVRVDAAKPCQRCLTRHVLRCRGGEPFPSSHMRRTDSNRTWFQCILNLRWAARVFEGSLSEIEKR